MSDIVVKQAQENDIPVLESILFDTVSWLNEMGQPLWGVSEVTWNALSKNYQIDNFYIAYVDGKPSGCMAIVDYDPFFWPDVKKGESLFVHKLAVTKAARKTGVADVLMGFFKKQGTERGVKTLRLDTHALRPKLRAFYERHGFVFIEVKVFKGDRHTAFYIYTVPLRINIRPAHQSDSPEIRKLLAQIVQVHYDVRPDIFRQSYRNESDCTVNPQDADTPVFVAVNEQNHVIGCLWCIIERMRDNSMKINRDWLVIDDICVNEEYRGHGIGRQLVDYAKHLAQEKGLRRIELNVYENNRDAVRFYERIGFQTQKRVMELNIPLTESCAQDTDEERHARIYPIILSEYNPAWPEWFAEEKANLEKLIGAGNIARISHYGSTSVPGLLAKPTVDILLEITETANIENLIAALPAPDYICLRGAGLTIPTPPPHLMFIKGYLPDGFAERVDHIHVVYPGDHDELRFRDYLIAHPEIAVEYAALKRMLFQNYEHDRDGYTEAKGAFVRDVVKKARSYDDCVSR